MSALIVAGDVSGSVTLQAPSAAGSTVLTLPSTSGTLVTTAGGNATSATNLADGVAGQLPYQSSPGVTAFVTNGTSGQLLVSAGSSAPSWTSTLTGITTIGTVNVISTDTTAVASRLYVLTASLTLTLPASPSVGDWVQISNMSGTTTPVVARNSSNIMALAEDLTLNKANAGFTMEYADATRGWVIY